MEEYHGRSYFNKYQEWVCIRANAAFICVNTLLQRIEPAGRQVTKVDAAEEPKSNRAVPEIGLYIDFWAPFLFLFWRSKKEKKHLQSRHINHKPIPHIAFKHTLISGINILDGYYFHITYNIMCCTVVQHFLCFGNAAY
jgi:hypothetical protein